MSRLGRAIVAGLVSVVFVGSPANARDGAWYVGIEGGVEMGGWTSADPGSAFLGTVGANFGEVRIEAELGFRSQSREFTVGVADLDQTSFMINCLYDVALGKGISLSLGAGLGTDNVEASAPFVNNSETEFAGQAIAGLNFAVTERVDLTANFRYMEPFAGTGSFADVNNTTVTAGLRFAL